MTEVLLHFAVPFAALSYFRGWRAALAASLVALFLDVDALLHVHRWVTHSLLTVGLISVTVLLLVRFFRPKDVGFGFAVVFGLMSHLALDLFTAYTPILWPLLGSSVLVDLRGLVHVSGDLGASFTAVLKTTPTAFSVFESFDGPLFTSEGLIVSVILVFSAVLYHVRKR